MGNDAAVWWIFAGFFAAPVALAVLVALTNRLFRTAMATRTRPSPAEATSIIEYARRRLRFLAALATSVLAGIASWTVFELPLTRLALGIGGAVYGLLVHLRCPGCDSSPGPRGLSVEGHCFRCGTRLH